VSETGAHGRDMLGVLGRILEFSLHH